MTRQTSHRPFDQSEDDLDLSHIFIGRDQQLDLFDIYLTRWKRLIFQADHQLDTLARILPSPQNKIQGLIVLLYGRGGFGKSTLLRHYHDIAQQDGDNFIVSKIVDWEFAIEGKRGLYNPPQGQEVDAAGYFKELCNQMALALDKKTQDFRQYQSAVRDVEKARKEASSVLDNMQKDDRYSWLRGLAVETIRTVVRTFVPGSGALVDNPSVKAAADEVAKITQTQISQIYTRLHDKLGTKLDDYLEPSLRLGLAFGYDLHEFAKNFPLLIFFDTYEEIDEGDQLLRIVMEAAGLRVGWVLAGRDNLWAGLDQAERSIAMEYGYKDIVYSDRGLSINLNAGDVGAFTYSDIATYFALLRKLVHYEPPLPRVTKEDAKRIFEVSQGIPLAVKIAAGLFVETADVETITKDEGGKRTIVDKMVRRYLLHTRTDQNERLKLYGLAMSRRADQPPFIATALRLTPEEAQLNYQRELSRLHRRYSFIFTEKEQPSLHQEVRHFLRLWLLEHRRDPELVAVNTRLKEAQEKTLKALEDQMQYGTLQERLLDGDWVGIYLDLTEQQFWLDPVEGVRYILPFMITAAIYRRDINKDVFEVGAFFEAAIRSPYHSWWEWAAQSLVNTTSHNSSSESLAGLEELKQLVSQRSLSFPRHPLLSHDLSDCWGEIEAAVWWRLGEAYRGSDDIKALEWFEKAMTRLGTQSELRDATAEAALSASNKFVKERKHEEQRIRYLDRAIELKPDYARAYGRRGHAYISVRNYQRAIEDCTKAIELDPTDAWVCDNRGFAYLRLRMYQQAIQDFDRSIELDPTYAKAYHNRGYAYDGLGDHQRAVQDYNQALNLELDPGNSELDPGNSREYDNRGYTYMRMGEYRRAIQELDRAIELDPDFVKAHENRGHSYLRLKEYRRAIQDFDRVIELDPNYLWTYYGRAYAYLWVKNTSQAKSDYSYAFKLSPTDVNAAWMAEWAGMSKQRVGIETAERLETIAAINPQDYIAYVCRAVAFGLHGKGKEGLEELEKAILIEPEAWDAYFWKGMLSAYYHQGISWAEVALMAIELSLKHDLPPILLTPLYWLKKDRPSIFEKYMKTLLTQYEV